MTEPSVVIRPQSSRVNILNDFAQIWKYRRLIKALVQRDIRVRYRNSSFGLIVSLLTPLLQVMVTTVAFGYFLGAGPSNLSVFIMCALLPWTYFQTVLLDSCATVYTYQGIMKKAYFPREVPVITACLSNGVQLMCSTAIFIAYRWGIVGLLHGWRDFPGLPPAEILWLPVIYLLTFLLTLGVALFVTAYSFFYEDVRVMLIGGLAALYFLLPINYFAENVLRAPGHTSALRVFLFHFYQCNPLSWLITAFKQVFMGVMVISAKDKPVVLSQPFDVHYLLLTIVTVTAILLIGQYNFSRMKWKFTERA
jgi:ABC-type polysaccharide/polyol phosphate export permease